GLLLPIWRRLPDEGSCRVYRLQADDGERIIGRLVSPAWVAEIAHEAPALSPADAWAALIDGKTVLDLADGLRLRRVTAMGEYRIELSGFTDGMVDRLKATGLVSEIVSWRLRLFVPTGAGCAAILATLFDRYPLVRAATRTAA
ncbi:MAG: hypothetical protein ACM3JG_04315, partial [Thiohalocapsa sp.]